MASLIAIADPEEHRSSQEQSIRGIFTGLIQCRGYEWDVTVHAESTQGAVDQLNTAYQLGSIKRLYPGYPQK